MFFSVGRCVHYEHKLKCLLRNVNFAVNTKCTFCSEHEVRMWRWRSRGCSRSAARSSSASRRRRCPRPRGTGARSSGGPPAAFRRKKRFENFASFWRARSRLYQNDLLAPALPSSARARARLEFQLVRRSLSVTFEDK